MAEQGEILCDILGKNREIERIQEEINALIRKNRTLKGEKNFDQGYTEAIESYYINLWTKTKSGYGLQ